MPAVITQKLIKVLQEYFALEWDGIHGVSHWKRVRENGFRLAQETGANTRVVEAFAFVHDSCRLCDQRDPEHGSRAGEFARFLVKKNKLLLMPSELELLVVACGEHTNGHTDEDITICTCWDADRLDLGRVGIVPDPKYLCTEPAKDPEMINWAYKRSIQAKA